MLFQMRYLVFIKYNLLSIKITYADEIFVTCICWFPGEVLETF